MDFRAVSTSRFGTAPSTGSNMACFFFGNTPITWLVMDCSIPFKAMATASKSTAFMRSRSRLSGKISNIDSNVMRYFLTSSARSGLFCSRLDMNISSSSASISPKRSARSLPPPREKATVFGSCFDFFCSLFAICTTASRGTSFRFPILRSTWPFSSSLILFSTIIRLSDDSCARVMAITRGVSVISSAINCSSVSSLRNEKGFLGSSLSSSSWNFSLTNEK